MRRAAVALLLCLAALVTGAPAIALTGPLEAIRQRGVVNIGVKTDYGVFGKFDAAGNIVGVEPDLAIALAQRIGVRAELVPVTSANRLQRLQDGTVDILIATLSDTQARRQIATLIEPNYYASGVTVLMPLNSHVTDWSKLRGQTVCAIQGHYANRIMAERYLLNLRILSTNQDAQAELRRGTCVGWLHDEALLAGEIALGNWPGYGIPLRPALQVPWAIAISAAARGSDLERLVSDTIADWHRTGFLLRLEQTHRIQPSAFLQQTSALWRRTRPDGSHVCQRLPDGQWPEECRNQALIASTEASGLLRLGVLFKERTNLDISVVYDRYDRTMFLAGAARTLALVVCCIVGGFVVGIAGALLIARRIPLLSSGVRGVLTFSRMTPPLLQMYVLSFGVGAWLSSQYGVALDGLFVAALCLSLYAGAANAYALVEAAELLFARVPDFRLSLATLPRAMRLARIPIADSLVNAVKATGLASAIAVPEIVSAATAVMAERGNASVMMNILMAAYFLLILAVIRILGALQRRYTSEWGGADGHPRRL